MYGFYSRYDHALKDKKKKGGEGYGHALCIICTIHIIHKSTSVLTSRAYTPVLVVSLKITYLVA